MGSDLVHGPITLMWMRGEERSQEVIAGAEEQDEGGLNWGRGGVSAFWGY